jgi:hypothetical protein
MAENRPHSAPTPNPPPGARGALAGEYRKGSARRFSFLSPDVRSPVERAGIVGALLLRALAAEHLIQAEMRRRARDDNFPELCSKRTLDLSSRYVIV